MQAPFCSHNNDCMQLLVDSVYACPLNILVAMILHAQIRN